MNLVRSLLLFVALMVCTSACREEFDSKKVYQRSTVQKVVVHIWGPTAVEGVMAILDHHEGAPAGRARVQLAIIKLSDRDRARLGTLVDTANVDFRDVIIPAEYPSGDRESNIKQYVAWLKSVGALDQ